MTTATVQTTLTDQTIASDMLIAAKTSIKELAIAITESATPEVRMILKKQLDTAIAYQVTLSKFMNSKGWYNAYNIKQQIQTDIQNANTALRL